MHGQAKSTAHLFHGPERGSGELHLLNRVPFLYVIHKLLVDMQGHTGGDERHCKVADLPDAWVNVVSG